MPIDIPAHFPVEYATNWRHGVGQKTSRVRQYATVSSIRGDRKSIPFIGKAKMRPITVRSGKTIYSDTPLGKRWLFKSYKDVAELIDEHDSKNLGQISVPDMAIIREHKAAAYREIDQTLFEAAIGDSRIGNNGEESAPLPNSQKVAVDYVTSGAPANSGLTLAKLIRARHIFGVNEAAGQDVEGDEEIHLFVSQQQITDLLTNVNQVSDADYAAIKALVDGKVTYFMGFHIHKNQLLPVSSDGIRSCIAWVKSGVELIIDPEPTVHVDVLPQQSHSTQIRTVLGVGAGRLEDEKVVEILCDETP